VPLKSATVKETNKLTNKSDKYYKTKSKFESALDIILRDSIYPSPSTMAVPSIQPADLQEQTLPLLTGTKILTLGQC
jgi:hypothetical protein